MESGRFSGTSSVLLLLLLVFLDEGLFSTMDSWSSSSERKRFVSGTAVVRTSFAYIDFC